MTERELIERTKQFALRVAKLVNALPRTIEGRSIASQLMRSGTSVAANYEEEADESAFWFDLIIDAGLLSESQIRPLLNGASEIVAIMASSKKTASRSAWQSQIANRNSKIS
jgi:hypothetical protein